MTSPEPLLLALIAGLAGAGLATLATLFWGRSRAHAADLARFQQIEALRAEHADALKREQSSHKEALARLSADHVQAIQQMQFEARQALTDAEASFEKRLKEQSESSLSVTVHPFVNTEADKGLLSRQVKVEVGYKYQLFVQGLPCFEPHAVVVESTTHKEVNEQTLELLKGKALDAAEAAVHLKGGGVATKLISIAKAAVRMVK